MKLQFYKKPLLALLCLLFLSQLSAQEGILEKAARLVDQSAAQLNLTAAELQQLQISSAHEDRQSGLTYVYIQQAWAGVKVFNAINSLAYKDGQLVSQTNSFAPKIDLYAVNNTAVLTPAQAVAKAAQYLNRPVPASLLVLDDQLSTNNKIVYEGAGLAREKIIVEKYWLRKEGSMELDLVWNVDIDLVNSIDWWDIRVNAVTGNVEDKNNLTVSCNFGHPQNNKTINNKSISTIPSNTGNAAHFFAPPPTVTTATYRVLPYPVESPSHGSFANEVDPWTKAGAGSFASTNGWHFDGTTNYNISRGNNVHAYLDTTVANSNGTQGCDTSTTAIPSLSFIKVFNTAITPKDKDNRKAAITNLFYWNNICHDITYKYGFTESSGNFQQDNLSRGGTGNDYVMAEAQDGSGTDNANMSTPADGGKPRMQMYLFTTTTPQRDGDIDNGVITHEYFHGVSNRLTGGAFTGTCLNNAEEGGEGWSDYHALMCTTNWATAVMADSIKSRPMGTYVEGQPVTGAGIRRHPYNYNKTINPITYSDMAASGEVHNIGEIWCSALWDMTWELCAQQGTISPNLFDSSANGGNVIAYRLMMQGLKLQPCSPGFIDARNAILKADSLLYGYAHRCAIWRAFARRGMGYSAKQGSSTSTSDQTAAFDMPPVMITSKTADFSNIVVNNNITYTISATCNCTVPLNNYILKDTLSAGLQFVSAPGGTNAGGIVTFTGQNFTIEGQTITKTIVAKMIAAGCTIDSLLYDDREAHTVGGFASTLAAGTSPQWVPSNAASFSAPNSWFGKDTTIARDLRLTSAQVTLKKGSQLSFRHSYNTEAGWDGGAVEISTDNGVTWTDLGAAFTLNGYNAVLGTGSGLAGRAAFSGNSGGFINSVISLRAYDNLPVRIRFRMASDASVAVTGWYVDNIILSTGCGEYNKAAVRNASDAFVDSSRNNLFVFSMPVVVLPLQLVSFTAQKQQKEVLLAWTTSNEVNTSRFEVEKSYNQQNWSSIGTVNSFNNSAADNHYNLTDQHPAEGMNYYRLKMIDRDGKFVYSDIRAVRFSANSGFSIKPNPVDDRLTVQFSGSNNAGYLSVKDLLGRNITTVQTSSAASIVNINTSQLADGVYLVNFTGTAVNYTERVVVKH